MRWNNKQTSWEPVRSDLYFFPFLVLLPSRVRILGWMGPHWAWQPYGHAKMWWATQWNVCRAGGAARPQWPHTPMLHGYRGLYGSLRSSCWTTPTLVVVWEAGGPLVTLQPTSPGVTQSTSGSLANEERVFLKRIQTAETLLKAYTYKQHECDYHIPTVYMVLRFPGNGKVHHHYANLHLPWHLLSQTPIITLSAYYYYYY